jgi:hypothetical protein
MSECVVRMEMPENCECCPMVFTADVPGYHWCAALEQEVEEGLIRPKECPIICQLPEGHGRLIDWDAFERIGFKLCRKTSECRAELGIPTNESCVVPAERSET